MLNLKFVFVLASEIIQVSDSIARVRCASGNVFFFQTYFNGPPIFVIRYYIRPWREAKNKR